MEGGDQHQQSKRICVVVLGDIGRSPRMQFHSISLAKHGFLVDLVGFGGSKPHNDVLEHPHIAQHLMSDVPDIANYVPRIFNFVFKTFWRSMALFLALLALKKPSHVLVQNPPCIPTFPVVWFYCKLRGSKLVIDWHNYSYTIMSINLHPGHILVRMTKWCEFKFGAKADSNLCVTKAMKNDLQARRNITATVLYDRPPEMFRCISDGEKHELFKKLAASHPPFKPNSSAASKDDVDETRFTVRNADGTVVQRPDRPALLVSSTSYTEDEDFSILLDALEMYENEVEMQTDRVLPDLVCAITGKGPLKEYYSNIIASKHFKHVDVVMPWLIAEDYPLLLASADVGVCLHFSSSGLDLPMKVVDMFGCSLPVCAVDYKCLGELVKHEENGFLFKDSHGLLREMKNLLQGFPRDSKKLDECRRNLKAFGEFRWDQCWDHNALPVFRDR